MNHKRCHCFIQTPDCQSVCHSVCLSFKTIIVVVSCNNSLYCWQLWQWWWLGWGALHVSCWRAFEQGLLRLPSTSQSMNGKNQKTIKTLYNWDVQNDYHVSPHPCGIHTNGQRAMNENRLKMLAKRSEHIRTRRSHTHTLIHSQRDVHGRLEQGDLSNV